MNRCGLLLLGAVFSCAASDVSFDVVTEQGIAQARQELTKTIERTDSRRRMATWCVGAAATAIGGWAVYRWLKPARIDRGVVIRGPFVIGAAPERKSLLKRSRDALGNGVLAAVSYMPTLVAGIVVNAVTQAGVAKALHFYRPLNWTWLSNEYTHIKVYLGQLKAAAAVLDAQSPVLDTVRHITINVDETADVENGSRAVTLPALDELIQLAACAQNRTGIDRAMYEQHLIHVWQALVQALQYHIAFIRYRVQQCPEASPFDAKQALYFEHGVCIQTAHLAKRLPELLAQANGADAPKSGLLAAVYDYCCHVTSLLESLEVNEIVQG